jgi:hypothetical protein
MPDDETTAVEWLIVVFVVFLIGVIVALWG